MIDHASALDPVSYIRRVGLRPEDSYGFVPMTLGGSELLYLYRDRPEYEEGRGRLSPFREDGTIAPPMETVEMQVPGQPTGMLGGIIEQAQELQRAYGGGQASQQGAPGDQIPTPDVEKLVEAAKLRASGAIDDAEYARLRAEAGAPDPGTPAAAPAKPLASTGGADIVAHRLYPEIRARSSTRQLDHFLPAYRKAVGVRPEDVYGVFPWSTRTSSGGAQGSSSTEWDDYWIVYRDRPEYASGRDAYASEMDDKGRWPEAVVAPGVGEAPGSSSELGEVEVEKAGWPRKALVIRLTGTGLADSLRERMSTWGYEPEDSFGFCPNFEHRDIYFAWRRR